MSCVRHGKERIPGAGNGRSERKNLSVGSRIRGRLLRNIPPSQTKNRDDAE